MKRIKILSWKDISFFQLFSYFRQQDLRLKLPKLDFLKYFLLLDLYNSRLLWSAELSTG
jgi:hypothetical protein